MLPAFISIINKATTAVPALKYTVGVAGMAAAIALIRSFQTGLRISLWGTFILMVLMIVLVVFARIAERPSDEFKMPARILIWSVSILFIGVSLLLAVSVFARFPVDLQFVLLPKPHPLVDIRASAPVGIPAAIPKKLSDNSEAIEKIVRDARSYKAISPGMSIRKFKEALGMLPKKLKKEKLIDEAEKSYSFEAEAERLDSFFTSFKY
jgi:hypothetical protein